MQCRKVRDAYPIHSLDYRKKLDVAQAELEGIKNLKLLRQTVQFWYNNMDHSIDAALDLFLEIKQSV